jgi:uncharacterized protein YdhG (YjbR/CyaY superfamily)
VAKFRTIDDYIVSLSEDLRARVEALRVTIRTAVPGLLGTIRYDMPAFRLGEATVIYFAVWKKHIGLYPIHRGTDAFEAMIAPSRAKTGTLHFPQSQPIPEGLMEQIVASQIARLGSLPASPNPS